MNLQHLRYALTVAECGSMTQAAEQLFIGQPNLSRAIRELEDALGFEVFRRTSKGMIPTTKGAEALRDAKELIRRADAFEKRYAEGEQGGSRFSLIAPHAAYVADAFAAFTARFAGASCTFAYREASATNILRAMLDGEYRLGVLRYQIRYERDFREALGERGLHAETICEFRRRLIVSKSNPIAHAETVDREALATGTEILFGDAFAPILPQAGDDGGDGEGRRVTVFGRASRMEFLNQLPDAYMWASPQPPALLERYGLVQLPCMELDKRYKDVLLHKNGYRLSVLDNRFIDELTRVKRAVFAERD